MVGSLLLRKSQAGEAGAGSACKFGQCRALCRELCECSGLTDGGGTQWGLNCSQTHLTRARGTPSAQGTLQLRSGDGVRGKPSRIQEESKLFSFPPFLLFNFRSELCGP